MKYICKVYNESNKKMERTNYQFDTILEIPYF